MECDEVRDLLPAIDEQNFSGGVLDHLELCDSCRSELAGYRELYASLAELAEHDIQPPAWLLGTLTENVAEAARRRLMLERMRRQVERATGEHRVATGSALGIAVLAAGAVLVGRRRQPPLAETKVA